MNNKRPRKQFDIYQNIKRELANDPEVGKLPYKQKLSYCDQVLCFLIKQLETKRVEIDIRARYHNILGELILHEDIGNPFNDNEFDAFITGKGRNKITKINFGDKVLKVNWKNVQPMALDQNVSLPEYLIKEYTRDEISIIFIVKNSSDPNYYTNVNNMFFPKNRITTEGFQYYLLPWENYSLGKKGTFNNYYFKIQSNGVMINMGLRFKNGQLTFKDFKK